MNLSSLIDSLWKNFSYDIAIDLGTANTKVLVVGKGVVIREPSIIVQHKKTKNILAIGNEAKRMIGKTPAMLQVVRPLRDGVISDFDACERMLKYFIHQVHRSYQLLPPKIPKPRLAIGIPSGITEVERKAVIDAALKAGARKVYLLEEPMAAALGSNLPVEEPTASLIVDIGGGTTEIAIVSLYGMVVHGSVRVGGNTLDEFIVQHMRRKYNLIIGETTAEKVKIEIGAAFPLPKDLSMEVKGRDYVTGFPKTVSITSSEIVQVLSQPLSQIASSIKNVLEKTPPELASDIIDKGIVLSGGTALLKNLDKHITHFTGVPVHIADDPLLCVVKGLAKALENFDIFSKSMIKR